MSGLRDRQPFFRGFRLGIPIMLGYLPVAFAFAVAAVGSGIPWPVVVLISATNLTSAGQQAGAGLLAACAPLPEVGAAVLIINLRYTLMSLSLAQKMSRIPFRKRLLLACGVTDEIYILAMGQPGALSGWFFTGLSAGPYVGWVSGTILGGVVGTFIPAAAASALGIALFAMFIAIVVPAAKESRCVARAAVLAAVLACLFRYLPPLSGVPAGWALILSAVLAAAVIARFSPRE